ncbi:MAG: ACP S-malonyltransferase, partial [Elusimicrobiota bacterium]
GQGAQYVDMRKDLRSKYRSVADTFAEADAVMKPILGERLSDLLFTRGDESPERLREMQERIKQTEVTQPAVLTADVALLRLLRAYGVEPDVVCGHSLGEYGALVAAGVLDFKDALLAVSSRAQEMSHLEIADCGKMASVAAPAGKVEAILQGIPGYAICANKNCPIQTVIAGATPSVEEALRRFAAHGIQSQEIEVSHAFHSEIVAPAQEAFGRFLSRIRVGAPSLPVSSNVSAEYFPKDPAEIRKLMVSQIASPVEFIRQAERMYADGVRVFVEVGPKRALTAFTSSTLEGKKDIRVFASNHPKRGGIHEFNDLLAGLEAAGIPLDLSAGGPGEAGLTSPRSLYTPEFLAWSQGAAEGPAPAVLAAPAHAAAPGGDAERWGVNTGPVVVSGISAGVPGRSERLFREDALDALIRGQNL